MISTDSNLLGSILSAPTTIDDILRPVESQRSRIDAQIAYLDAVLHALAPLSAATRLDPTTAREPKNESNQAQQDCSCALTTEELRHRDAQFSRMLTRLWL